MLEALLKGFIPISIKSLNSFSTGNAFGNLIARAYDHPETLLPEEKIYLTQSQSPLTLSLASIALECI